MNNSFTILGAGALGSILGAHLAQAGHAVTMIARGERAQHVRKNGLEIRGLAQLSVPVRVVEDPAELTQTDVLVVAIKTPGTAQALERLAHLKVDSAFSIQNGVQKNDLLATIFGRDKTLGALADTSGELLPSGEVLFTRNVAVTIGELAGGMSERASRIAAAIDSAGVRSNAVGDIVSLEWSKFVVWAGMMMLSVVTRVETWKYLGNPDAALLLVRSIHEMGALAKAKVIAITDRSMVPAATILNASEAEGVALVQRTSRDYYEKAREHRMSALQDLEAGRPLELHETVGDVLQQAQSLGISMPHTESLYHAAAAIGRLTLRSM